MRDAFPETWLRIHSLPDSKRYPENEAEKNIILDRYSAFGTALLAERARCLVIQSCYNGFGPNMELMPELRWSPIHRVGEGEDAWDSWMTHSIWEPSNFAALLLKIAECSEGSIAFVSEVTDCVFAPYDGGADGFSCNKTLLSLLSEKFAPWRSSILSGL
ncbi:MAG: hypothetical protein ABIT37_23885 [Luteolibacter sp.]